MPHPRSTLSLGSRKAIDQICLDFEAEWRASPHPPLEPFVEQMGEPERTALLGELLLLDLDYRQRAGEQPTLADYGSRFPGDRRCVERAFRKSGLPIEAPEPAHAALGNYEVLGVIARGGMGTVYKARQRRLDRVVALKTITAGSLATAEEVERFHQEARNAACLQHPLIVAIHEMGEHEGQHFFTMDFIEGESLAERVRGGPLPARQAAQYVQTLAETLQFAHERGILHRDLKPSNVMIDGSDRPHILDFGLARRDESLINLTITGQILGTPSYMAPEQAEGDTRLIGPRSDLYSLGAMFYELLTGRPPFRGETALATLRHVVEQETVAPHLLNPAVPRDLEVICLKCLQKEPRLRYGSALELAADLGRYLRGEPIEARPIAAPMRLARWCRRQPVIASMAAGLFLTLVLGTALSAWFAIQAHNRAEVATERLWESYLAQARAIRRTGRVGQRVESLAALVNAGAIRPAPELRDEAIACLNLIDLKPRRRWNVACAVWSLPDPRILQYAVGDERGTIWVRRTGDDQELARMISPDQRPALHAFFFHPDGRLLWSWHPPWEGLPAEARVWEIATGRLILQAPAAIGYSCDFAPDRPEFAALGPDGTIRLFDSVFGRLLHTIPCSLPAEQVPTIARYHPSRRQLALLARERTWLHVADLERGAMVGSFELTVKAYQCAWHPKEDRLALACEDGAIRLLNTQSGRIESVWTGHAGEVIGVDFAPDGAFLASRSWDATARIWECATGHQLVQVDGDFLAFHFSLSGREILSRDRRGELAIWEVVGGQECRAFRSADEGAIGPESLQFSPDGRCIATADPTGVALWDAWSFNPLTRLAIEKTSSMAFSKPDNALITLSDGRAFHWPLGHNAAASEVSAGPPIGLNPPPRPPYRSIDVSRDGRTLLAVLANGQMERIMLHATPQQRPLGVQITARATAISPEGRTLARVTGNGRGIELWDLVKGRKLRDLHSGDSGPPRLDFRVLAFSPLGGKLIACTPGSYHMYDTVTGLVLWAIQRPDTDMAGPIAFCPDGRLLALAHDRHTLQLVEAASGRHLATIESPDACQIRNLAFSPDGRRVALGGGNLVRVLDLAAISAQLAEFGFEAADCQLGSLDAHAKDTQPRRSNDRDLATAHQAGRE